MLRPGPQESDRSPLAWVALLTLAAVASPIRSGQLLVQGAQASAASSSLYVPSDKVKFTVEGLKKLKHGMDLLDALDKIDNAGNVTGWALDKLDGNPSVISLGLLGDDLEKIQKACISATAKMKALSPGPMPMAVEPPAPVTQERFIQSRVDLQKRLTSDIEELRTKDRELSKTVTALDSTYSAIRTMQKAILNPGVAEALLLIGIRADLNWLDLDTFATHVANFRGESAKTERRFAKAIDDRTAVLKALDLMLEDMRKK